MSKPRELWWPYAKNVVRAYPKLHRVAQTGKLTAQDRRHHDAVQYAIECSKNEKNYIQRMKLIDLVYWKQSHTVAGAGRVVGYEYSQARAINGQFIRLVATGLGLGETSAPRAKSMR